MKVTGRCRETHQQCVEVLKDGAILLVDGTVGFINNDEIEVTGAIEPRPIAGFIDTGFPT